MPLCIKKSLTNQNGVEPSLAAHFNNMEKDFMRLGNKADKNTSSAVDELCATTRIKNIKMGGK